MLVIVDVREESEYQAGHIPGALLIPLSTINAKNQQLPKSDQTLLVYCRSGHRSQKAAQNLSSLAMNMFMILVVFLIGLMKLKNNV